MNSKSTVVLKQTIDDLIKAGTTFNVEQLDLIYHDSLKVVMINQDSQKKIANKQAFKELFIAKKENGDAPLNTWAEFHHIETSGINGHVIVTRKVNLIGIEQKITLSIDLIWEENRWQVIREIIITHP